MRYETVILKWWQWWHIDRNVSRATRYVTLVDPIALSSL